MSSSFSLRVAPFALLISCALGQNPANVIFLEPEGKIDTHTSEVRADMPL